jgi:PAS domain S-box-containing protein
VLGSALLMFVLTAGLLWEGNHQTKSPFTYWYTLTLLLIAVSVSGMMIQSSRDSLLNWTCRITQYLSGIYMFIAALTSKRMAGVSRITFGKMIHEARYRSGVAVAIVLGVTAFRLIFLQMLGTHVPFLMLYPAVILAALYGGWQAGLVGTVLSAVLIDYFWIEPVDRLAIGELADWISLFLFLLSCLMTIWIIELLNRARTHAFASEMKARLATEREMATVALRKSEEYLKFQAHLLANVSDVIYATDLQMRVTFWNFAAEKIYGWKKEDVLGKSVFEFVGSEIDLTMRDKLVQELHEKGQVNRQIEHTTKAGTCIIFDSVTMTLRDENGITTGFVDVNRDITERKRVEEKLRANKEDYRRIVQTANEGIMTTDVSGTITFVNAKMSTILGYEVAELIGKSGLTLIPPEENDLSEGRIEKRSAGLTESYDIKFIHKNGNIIWAHASGAPIYNLEDQHVGNLGMYADITERKKAEEALEFQARLLSEVHDAVFSSDSNFTITYWNQAAENMFGWTKEEVLGKNSGELLKPKLKSSSRDQERLKIRSANHWEGEVQYIRKNGTYFYVDVNATVLKDAKGEGIGQVIAARDITEHKHVEAELRKSEERFRLALKNAPVSVATQDCNLVYLWAYNQQTRRPDEIIGKTDSDLFSPEDIGWLTDIKRKVMETGSEEHVAHWLTSNGKRIFLDLHYEPIRNPAGAITGIGIAAVDLTEQKLAEEAIADYIDELTSANKELESYAYSISHDLRAPLRAMKGFSYFLLEDYSEKLDTQAKEYINRIIISSDKMSELIEDMLSLAKISRQEVVPHEINLCFIAEAVVNVLCQGDPTKKVDVVIAKDLNTRGDSRLLEIAISNLIGNAWKYSSKTQNALIEFGAMEKDGHQVYYVRDNGTGFNMAFAGKLFEPFRRFHSETEFPGTGIGLAIVKRVVEKHGGAIWAESEVGKGATFYFTLVLANIKVGGRR